MAGLSLAAEGNKSWSTGSRPFPSRHKFPSRVPTWSWMAHCLAKIASTPYRGCALHLLTCWAQCQEPFSNITTYYSLFCVSLSGSIHSAPQSCLSNWIVIIFHLSSSTTGDGTEATPSCNQRHSFSVIQSQKPQRARKTQHTCIHWSIFCCWVQYVQKPTLP